MDSKILDRIRKLLARAQSDNVNEAALAAAEAQRLMMEYEIGQADLEIKGEAREPREEVEEEVLEGGRGNRVIQWRVRLAGGIANAFHCSIIYVRHTDIIRVFGRPSDVQTVRYLMGYLTNEINRLCDKGWQELIEDYETGEYGSLSPPDARTWKNAFRIGAAVAIREKLDKSREEKIAALAADAQRATALVLVRKDEEIVQARIEELKKKHDPKKKKWRPVDSPDGHAAGYAAGQTVHIGEARAGLEAPAKRLKG